MSELARDSLKLRRDITVQRCGIQGCEELASQFLPQRMQVPNILWCEPHAKMLARMIAKRDYQDFVSALRSRGVNKEPVLVTVEVTGDNRRCSIPGCGADFYCGIIFEPYKDPGRASVCSNHAYAVQEVNDRLNGPRLIHDLRPTTRPQDKDRNRRRRLILAAYAKHRGKPKYIEAVCGDLQKERIKMPSRWLADRGWVELRVEPSDWLVAYRSPIAKSRIQKYVSKICGSAKTAK